MPWIPYTYDNHVMIGIGILWALIFALWVLLARKRRRTSKEYTKGLVVAVVGLVICLIFYSSYILARQAVEVHEAMTSSDNLRALSQGILNYAEAHNDHLPPADKWATDSIPYIDPSDKPPRLLQGPGTSSPYSYAFNRALSGISGESIANPSSTVLVFECDAKTINASGSAADFCRFRHVGTSYYVCADGHVRSANKNTVASLNWKP